MRGIFSPSPDGAPEASGSELSRHHRKVAGSERRQREMHILVNYRSCAAQKKLFEADGFYWRNFCYYIGRDQKYGQRDEGGSYI